MSTHANAPLTPEGRRRLWGVGKNAVTSRNRAAVARAKGRLRGKQPKLSAKQQTELRRMHTTGDSSIADLAELFTSAEPPCTGHSGAKPPAKAEQPELLVCGW